MKSRTVERESMILAGIDFYGNPYEKAGGWSTQNAIGELWARFLELCDAHKGQIKHPATDPAYEVWVEMKQRNAATNEYIFVGVEIDSVDDLPLELVAKALPATRYAVFTLKGAEIKSDWPSAIEQQWLPEAGFKQSHHFIIEYYDPVRFKGLEDPESELDIYVPIS